MSFSVLSFHCALVYFSFFSTFFISPASLTSHPGFVFVFVFMRGIPISSLASFARWCCRLGYFFYNLSIFSVSTLTFSPSWFLMDDNEAFFLVMLSFIITSMFLSSFVNSNVVVLSSEIFWFSIFCVSVCVLGSSWASSSWLTCQHFSSVWGKKKSSFSLWSSFSITVDYISLLFHSLRVFHVTVSWWSFTGVWMTASLLKSIDWF